MAEPNAQCKMSLKKGLLWLKRLQGALDSDDSSDSSSQLNAMTCEKEKQQKKEKKTKENGRKHISTKELRQHNANDCRNEEEERRKSKIGESQCRRVRRSEKKSTVVRRKRLVSVTKEEQSKELKKLKLTQLGEKKSGIVENEKKLNLDAHRIKARGNDRSACKVGHDEVSEIVIERKKRRTQTMRSERRKDEVCGGREGDDDGGISQRRRQLSPCQKTKREFLDELSARCKVRRSASIARTEEKFEHANAIVGLLGNSIDLLKQDEDKKDQVEFCSAAKATPAEPTLHDSKYDKPVILLKTNDQEVCNKFSCANGIMEPDKVRQTVLAESTLHKTEKNEIDVTAQVKSTEGAGKVVSFEKLGSASAAQEGLQAAMTPSVSPDSGVRLEPQALFVAVDIMPNLVEKNNDERQAEPAVYSHNADGAVKNKDMALENSGKDDRDERVVKTMILHCRKMEAERLNNVPSTAAELFVIPKRSSGNNDKIGQTPVTEARSTDCQISTAKLLDQSVPVTMSRLSSPGPKLKLSKVADIIHPPTARQKRHVPIKTALVSTQDRVLMRLSRKRNSIFMAATELAAEVPEFQKCKSRIMGYEVYDFGGKVLPDLIPRLSCITKGEMASNQKSYTPSFFGVSLSAPEALGQTCCPEDETESTDCDTRKINCYEELRFSQPEHREFYQRRMYGTVFVPQKIRGWITLIVRNARFERKSTGIRFNQDRDREEFAASLSKRYTINRSVPRCDIPRENWHKLMRNQPSFVYLHYYNREDAEQASHKFCDDLGHQLELQLNLKAGVVIKASSCTAVGPRNQHTFHRSYGSDQNVPKPLLLSSQHDSVREIKSWRTPVPKSDSKYSRYALSRIQSSFQDGRGHDTFDVGGKRPRPMIEGRTRSRSRSRSKSSYVWHNDCDAHEGKVADEGVERNRTLPPVPGACERMANGNESGSSAVRSDADTLAQKRVRSSPCSRWQSPNIGPDWSKRELVIDDDRGGQDGGECLSRITMNTEWTVNERDGRSEPHWGRSPPRRWLLEPSNTEVVQRRSAHSNYSCTRSRSPTSQYRFDQQRSDRYLDKQRSRSRSRPGTMSEQNRRGINYSDPYMGHRDFREYKHAGAYDDSSRNRSIHFDKKRGDYNGHRAGSHSRSRQ